MAAEKKKPRTETPPQKEKVKAQHEFSDPWEDSDLVLIVEDQKLHVHRFILKLASPVFKAMFSKNFKEKDAAKVSLPGKKASEFVDLLRQIYPQFNRNKINLSNVAHIYRLADEYQMNNVIEVCREFLTSTEKTDHNVMQVLKLAELCQGEDVRQQCYNVLEDLSIKAIENKPGFKDLDDQTVKELIYRRAKRLEDFLKEIKPQMIGLADFALFLLSEEGGNKKLRNRPNLCSAHHTNKNKANIVMADRLSCVACMKMLNDLVKCSQYTVHLPVPRQGVHYSDTGEWFDEKVIGIFKKIDDIL